MILVPSDGNSSGDVWFRRWRSALLALVLPVLIVTLWQVASDRGLLPSTLIASPGEVARDLFVLLRDGTIVSNTGWSLCRLLPGFFVGSLFGFLLGVATGMSRTIERIVAPSMQVVAPIPPIAWTPILLIVFGFGEVAKIALISVATSIVMFFNTVHGIRTADAKLVEVGISLGKSRWVILRQILLPSALPAIFLGLRGSMRLSWILLLAAEGIASSRGIGWFMWDARGFSRPADMIAAMVTIGVLGKISEEIILASERRVVTWRDSYSGM